MFVNFALFCVLLAQLVAAQDYYTEDQFVPDNCDTVVKAGDHVLVEYEVLFHNGTRGASLKQPSQLFHILVNPADDSPVINNIKGMCKNATRRLVWTDPLKLDLRPLFVKDLRSGDAGVGVSVDITAAFVTTADEYQIFSSLREANFTNVAELIDNHVGVNAVDEWGQTPLMIAVQIKHLPIIAALLNTRLPKVDVNAAKASGYTALFYAVEHSSPSVLQALLRRGANPNASSKQKGSRGNTPLHFACLLEKTKHAELLLEFGADPFAKNEHGETPQQLIPNDAVRSTKLFFRKMFEDAAKRTREAEVAYLDSTQSVGGSQRTDL